MAARRNMRPRRSTAYMHGNAVPKLEPLRMPSRRPDERVRRQRANHPAYHETANRQTANHQVRRNREKALQMDLPYVVMLSIAAICTLWVCVNYLHMQSAITAKIHSIEGNEARLETLKTENDALETSINTSVDLDHIYKVATQELGMVYANKDQILQYDNTESGYVRQNEDIPK